MRIIKNLVIGDVHGNYWNLFEFLKEQGAIDAEGNRINRDTLKVYSVGDLIDGSYNRQGDLLCLENAEDWFDAICIGNHEFAFISDLDFGGRRTMDLDVVRDIVNLIDKGVYVPSILVENFLVTHAGLSDRWGFYTEKDAYDAINYAWELAIHNDDNGPNDLFFGLGAVRGRKAKETGGIFWLDWSEERNKKINQIVGHSTFYEGPIVNQEQKYGTYHWNVDVGGKSGYALGGVIVEGGSVETVFWGDNRPVYEYDTGEYGSWLYPKRDEDLKWKELMGS